MFPRLLDDIAADDDWAVTYTPITFAEGLTALDVGGVDGLAAVAKTERRLGRFKFPREQVISNWGQIFAPDGDAVRTFLNLRDLSIAATEADVYLESENGLRNLLDRLDVTASFGLYDSYRAAAQATQDGFADVALMSRFAGGALAEEYGLEPTAVIVAPVELHIAFSKRSRVADAFIADFDARLLALKTDQTSRFSREADALLAGEQPRSVSRTALIIAIALIAAFAVAVGFIWRFNAMRRRLEHMALTDPLTEAPNRRAFMDIAEREFRRRLRDDKPLSVAMIDADRFKSINDSYGHDVGDLVLIDIVETLRATLRGTDAYGRLGGEEFGVLMPATTRADASRVAEKLRLAFAERELSGRRGGMGRVRYTVSIGVAQAEATDRHFDETLKRADEAVYRAKALGRNRVEAG